MNLVDADDCSATARTVNVLVLSHVSDNVKPGHFSFSEFFIRGYELRMNYECSTAVDRNARISPLSFPLGVS